MDAASGDSDILTATRNSGRSALDQLFPLVYEELHRVAHRQLGAHHRAADGTPTLTTSGLVNEVYLKLVDQKGATWRDRAHFVALAGKAMRHILVDRARARAAAKRGGERRRVTLDEEAIALDDQPSVMLDVDEALRSLESIDPRLGFVVECRFFGGMSEKDIAEVLGVGVRTIQRDLVKASMLLRRALER
jgi:RNA polymerase sigma factor (TIGR02999 family)